MNVSGACWGVSEQLDPGGQREEKPRTLSKYCPARLPTKHASDATCTSYGSATRVSPTSKSSPAVAWTWSLTARASLTSSAPSSPASSPVWRGPWTSPTPARHSPSPRPCAARPWRKGRSVRSQSAANEMIALYSTPVGPLEDRVECLAESGHRQTFCNLWRAGIRVPGFGETGLTREGLDCLRIVLTWAAERGGVEAPEIMETGTFRKTGPCDNLLPRLVEVAALNRPPVSVCRDEPFVKWLDVTRVRRLRTASWVIGSGSESTRTPGPGRVPRASLARRCRRRLRALGWSCRERVAFAEAQAAILPATPASLTVRGEPGWR